MLRKIAFAVCLIVLFTAVAAPALAAEEGKWMVRLRALNLRPANESDAIDVADLQLAKDQIEVSKKTFPEVDITYFFTPNIAAELVLTYPQKHDVDVKGVGNIGSFKHLPPTLSIQYHFLPEGQFRPYVGLGLNYTRISDVDITVETEELGVVKPDLSSSSTGFSIGAGFDVKVADKWFFNFDVKKVKLGADITVAGVGKIGKVNVDPWLISVGAGYRF